MVPPENGFLSLRTPIFGSSYYQCFYTCGIAPSGDGDDGGGDDDGDCDSISIPCDSTTL